jgi:two-component system response regulator
MSSAQVDILLVEDNKDDLDLTLAALRETNGTYRVAMARDGQEALDFVFCEGAFAGRDPAEQPRLILLDLNLPKIDGLQVLKKIKTNSRTRHIPVVMLTSSARKADLESSYNAGANSYLVKSVNFEQFTRDVRQLGDYWLNLNRASDPSS